MEISLLSASAAFNLPVYRALTTGEFAPLVGFALGLLVFAVGLLMHDAFRPFTLAISPRGALPTRTSELRAADFPGPTADAAGACAV